MEKARAGGRGRERGLARLTLLATTGQAPGAGGWMDSVAGIRVFDGGCWSGACRAILGPALVLVLALASGLAQAVVAVELQLEGWRELPNPKKQENVFSRGPGGAIEVVSRDSVSTLYKPIQVKLRERPILAWRWRVDDAAPATDLSVKGEDDCSLAVYAGFPYQPEQASWFERVKRPLVEFWVGEDAPGRVLRYVFCGSHKRGEAVKSPYLGTAGMIKVLRPADSPTGTWLEERVDVAADYRHAFGALPPDPTQLAVEADTDDTHSASRAYVADLDFVPREPAAERGRWSGSSPTR